MAARQPDHRPDDQESFRLNIRAARGAATDELEGSAGNRNSAIKELGFDRLARKIEVKYGLKVTGQTLSQYHGNVALESMSPEYVAFLATAYGFTVEELSPRLAERCAGALKILSEARIRWRVAGVDNPPVMQGVLALDFGHFHAAPRVVCRCGAIHELRVISAPCAYCATPTFDEHLVCAQCREIEAIERHADGIIDLVELTARSA